MKQSIIITTRRKPKTSVRGGSGKGPIDLAKPSKRPARRRLSKGGIRFFDLGSHWDSGSESWVTENYVAGASAEKLLERFEGIPKDYWPSIYRPIDEEANEATYKLNLTTYVKDDPSQTVPLGSWKDSNFQFSEAGWNAVTNQEAANYYYDVMSDASGYRIVVEGYFDAETPVINTVDQFGALVESALTKYNTPNGAEEGFVITTTPTPPVENDLGVFIPFQKTADWFFFPRLCRSVAALRPSGSSSDHSYVHYRRLNREGGPPDKDIWPSHLSVLPRRETASLRGYSHERETPIPVPPDAVSLFSEIRDLTPAWCCNYQLDTVSLPSLSELTVNKHFTTCLQDPVHPKDLFKINSERVPEMIIHQNDDWLYLWNTSEWYEEGDYPYSEMPWPCYVWGNDPWLQECRCGSRSWHCF